MFGIELGEMFTLGIVALLVFGPERLPEVAVKAAHFIRRMRSAADSARSELSTSFGTDLDDLRELNPRTFVRKHVLDPANEDGLLSELRTNGKEFLAGSRNVVAAAGSAKSGTVKKSLATSSSGTAPAAMPPGARKDALGSKAVSAGGPSLTKPVSEGVGAALPPAMAPAPLLVGERPPFDVEAT